MKKCACGRDMVLKDWKHLWVCTRCGRTKPIDETPTNADRIRAMSDEELARFLAEVENRRSAAGGGAIWKGAAHAKEWLKQPYEEDT